MAAMELKNIIALITILLLGMNQSEYTFQKLLASDGAAGDLFGNSMSMYSNYLVIGAPASTGLGKAYVFKRNPKGNDYTQTAILKANDSIPNDLFGDSVSIYGSYIAVGAFLANNTASGSVYVFKRDQQNESWTETAKLISSNTSVVDYFGRSVAMYGKYIVIGAPSDDTHGAYAGIGSVYIFERNSESNNWTQVAKLFPDLPTDIAMFGDPVAIYKQTVVVGAREDNNHIANFSGSVYVFDRDPQSNNWTRTAKLYANDAGLFEYFGSSVSVYGDYIVAGAMLDAIYDDPYWTSSGAVYIFERDPQSNNWNQTAKFTQDLTQGDSFGTHVAIYNDVFVASDFPGTGQGNVYLYAKNQTNHWEQQTKFVGSLYNGEIIIYDKYVVLGSTRVADNGVASGGAFYTTINVTNHNISDATNETTHHPSYHPTNAPSANPTITPSMPTFPPSLSPSAHPTVNPSSIPSTNPTTTPLVPTFPPSLPPSVYPTLDPSTSTDAPSILPSLSPTLNPSTIPSDPTIAVEPSYFPTPGPLPTHHPLPQMPINTTVFPYSPSQRTTTESMTFPETSMILDPTKKPQNNSMLYIVLIIALSIISLTCIAVVIHYGSNRKLRHIITEFDKNTADTKEETEDKYQLDSSSGDAMADNDDNITVDVTQGRETLASTSPSGNSTMDYNMFNTDETPIGVRRRMQSDALDVQYWLQSVVELPQYYSDFVNSGYESLHFIKEIPNITELDEMGIKTKAHQKRMFEEIIKLKGEDGGQSKGKKTSMRLEGVPRLGMENRRKEGSKTHDNNNDTIQKDEGNNSTNKIM
eukprot:290016_1